MRLRSPSSWPEPDVPASRVAPPQVRQPGVGGVPEYREWLRAAGVRAPVTGWSVADFRVAQAVLCAVYGPGVAVETLRAGRPGFPRRHERQEDYLVRTVSRAGAGLDVPRFFPPRPSTELKRPDCGRGARAV